MSRPIRIAHLTTVDLSLRYLLLGQLRALRDAGFEVTAISAPGRWSAGLAAEGIRHVPWRNATRAWNPKADALALRELVALLRHERFDLVHTHNPKPGILGRVAARLAGVPCVVNTVHGLYATPEDRPAKRLAVLGLERLAARLSDLELYQSAEDLAWARRVGVVSPARSLLLGNGIDLAEFDPRRGRRAELREELDVRQEETVVATVGRLVAEKGYRELFTAAASVRAGRGDVRFLAIGDRDGEKADAIDAAEVARAHAHVTFTGWRQDVRDLLAAADVFVLPSWREGMPRSAIEAAAMGKPLVLTDVRGCREVARDGVEGLLVPPRQPGALARAIAAVVDDSDLRERLGAAARARALERFDERRVAELVIDEYAALLARKGIAPPTRARPRAVRLRRARAEDASSLARLHRESLPDSFLPTLGDGFLRRMYRALAEDRGAVAVVAEEDGEVRGFATGVVSGRDFSWRFCRRHALPALPAVLPRLARSGVSRRVLESARHAGAGEADDGPDSELVSIAVASGARGRGLGRALAGGVVSGLGELGANEVKVVVGAENARGNDLYSAMGFDRRRQIALHDGVPSNVWVIGCPS